MSRDRYISPQLRNAFALFAGIAGLTGVAVTLLTAPTAMRTITIRLLFSVVIVLLIAIAIPEAFRHYRAASSLPSDAALDRLCTAYRIEQATADELGWIAQLQASVYSREDAIPEYLLREWFSVNPAGFSIVKTADGRPVGHLDILPLRPVTLHTFLGGDIVEREIRGDSLYSVIDRGAIRHLYVESIILCPRKPRSNAAAMVSVLSDAPAIIGRIADLHSVEAIYAIAASPAGERLMRRLGFALLRAGERRKDGHKLFVARPSVVARNVLEVCGRRARQSDALEALTKGL